MFNNVLDLSVLFSGKRSQKRSRSVGDFDLTPECTKMSRGGVQGNFSSRTESLGSEIGTGGDNKDSLQLPKCPQMYSL